MTGLFIFDGAIIAGFVLTYLLVTRRRARIYLMVDHLSVVARRSMPIHGALRVLARDAGGILGLRLERLARRVEEGSTLEQALEKEPRVFPPLLGRLITLGERHGTLGPFLEEARRSYRLVTEAPAQSVYYLLYPIFLSIFVNLCLTFLGNFILPKFREVFSQVHAPAPHLLWIPWILLSHQIMLVLCVGLVVAIFSGAGSLHFGMGLFGAKGLLDRLVLGVPLLGAMVREASLHAFAMTTGILLRAGALLPEAAGAAAESERNSVLRRRYARVTEALREGSTLSGALRAQGVSAEFVWFVEAGEASGALPGYLLDVATHFSTRARFKAGLAWKGMIPLFAVLNGSLVGATCIVIFGTLVDVMKGVSPW